MGRSVSGGHQAGDTPIGELDTSRPFAITSPTLRPVRWRTGRKVGRTIYAQLGPAPSDDDPLIGVMDTAELAAEAVRAYNARGTGPT